MTRSIEFTPKLSAQLALPLKQGEGELDEDAVKDWTAPEQVEPVSDSDFRVHLPKRKKAISPEQAWQISESAKVALDDGSIAGETWVAEYAELRKANWPWRVAAYIAWASTPRRIGDVERWPGTQLELAQIVLGLRSDRVIRKWRQKNPSIDEAVGLLQADRLKTSRGAIIAALVESASTPDYKNHADREMALRMTGDYVPQQDVTVRDRRGANDLSTLSDAELDDMLSQVPEHPDAA